MVFNRFKKMMGSYDEEDESASEFIEIDLEHEKSDSKIYIKTFILKNYEDINPILASLREGYSIAIIDIRLLKQRDIVELKRSISKIKKTVEALDGKIAGFGENTVIATPSKVFDIQRGVSEVEQSVAPQDDVEMF